MIYLWVCWVLIDLKMFLEVLMMKSFLLLKVVICVFFEMFRMIVFLKNLRWLFWCNMMILILLIGCVIDRGNVNDFVKCEGWKEEVCGSELYKWMMYGLVGL